AELVIFLALFRITQHFVSFVDLLKFFFRFLLILCDVRMIFPRQLAECATDFILGCRLRHSESLVIISELNGHPLESLRTSNEVQMGVLFSRKKTPRAIH